MVRTISFKPFRATALAALFSFLIFPAVSLCAELADDAVVASVEGNAISAGEIRSLIKNRRLFQRGGERDRQTMTDLLEEQVLQHLIVAESGRYSLNGRDLILERLRRAAAGVANTIFDQEYVVPKLAIDSTVIDSFYQANISRYTTSRDQRWVRHITVAHLGEGIPENYSTYVDPVYDGWDPERKIDSIYIRLAHGEEFGALASVHTEEPHSKGTRGDMGWVSSFSLPEGEFGDSCLSLPLNKISRPFATELGWHIVQVLKERDAGPVTIDEPILRDITKFLISNRTKEIRTAVADSLVATCTIAISAEQLEVPDSDIDTGAVWAVVNGRDTLYAAAYFTDFLSWQTKYGAGTTTAEQKHEIIMESYFDRACWNDMLRDMGFYARPEVQELLVAQDLQERKNLVRLWVSAVDVHPDSTDIIAYYNGHPDEFRAPQRSLKQAWHQIRTTVRGNLQAADKRSRVRQLEKRYRVQRYPDRLAQITLPERL